jgi:predicted nicotinamide N-methyase
MDFAAFLRSATVISGTELCPELRLHQAEDLTELWRAQESWLGRTGLPPPFWGVAWPGGQGLARYTLDNPDLFRDRSVLDMGSGSGLCAIAAAKAGAGGVAGADIDPFSLEAIAANAELNEVRVGTIQGDVIGSPPRWDVILAGDLWYERFLADRVTEWLTRMALEGTTVLFGDGNRAFFPRGSMEEIERYAIKAPESFDRDGIGLTKVWRVRPVRL